MPQSVPLPIDEEEEYEAGGNKTSLWITLVGVLAVLVVGGIGWAIIPSSGDGSSGGGSAKQDILKRALRFDGEFADAVKNEDTTAMKAAIMGFPGKKIPGCSPEFQDVCEKQEQAMISCYSSAELYRTNRNYITREMYLEAVQKYIDGSKTFIRAVDKERTQIQSGKSASGKTQRDSSRDNDAQRRLEESNRLVEQAEELLERVKRGEIDANDALRQIEALNRRIEQLSR
jgi:hypothetical protein